MEETIEKKVVLEVVAPDAVETVGQIKTNIKLLKEGWEDANGAFHKGLNDLKVGSEAYQQTLNEIKLNQNMLKDANYATASSMEAVSAAAAGEGESYNALVHRMAALKEEYRTLDPSIANQAKRMGELSAQINETNSKLKAYDSMIGNHQRNVGNYTQSIMTAFNGVKIGGVNALGAVKGLKGGFDALSATPVIAIIGALVQILSKVSAAMKSSEANTRAMKEALAVFEPIMNAVTRGLQAMGGALVKVVEFAGKAAKWLGLVNGKSEETVAIAQEENALIDARREMLVEEARLQAEIADLQAKAADKQKYTAKERMEFTKQATDIEEELYNKKYALQERENALLERKAALTDNSIETNDKLAEGQKKLYDMQAQHAQRQRSITAQANKAAIGAAADAKSAAEQIKAELKEIDDLVKQIDTDADKAIADVFAKWEKERETAAAQAKKMEDIRLQYIDAAATRRAQDAEMEIEDARALEERKFEIAQDGLKRRAELLKQFYQDALARGDVELALEYEQQAQDLEYQIEYEGYLRRKALREKEVEQRKAALQGMVSATTSIMGAIADAYEAAGDLSEAEAQRVKALRIAATVIETIAGAVSAYMGTIKAMAGSPLAIPVAVATAGSVLATGYAQIAKMQNTDATGKSVSVSESRMQAVAVNAPTPVQMVPVTRSLTSASEEARLNETQRVVLVQSDLEAAGRRVEIVDNETNLG